MLATIVAGVIQARPFKGRDRLVKALLRRLDGRAVQSAYGVKMRVRSGDFTNYACISGAYHRDYDDVFAVVDRLEPGMAFVDVGANAGLFSMVAGKRVGPEGVVLAFEPNRTVFADLLANIELNGLANVSAFNAAVGSESGTAYFTPGEAEHTGAGHLSEDGVAVQVIGFSDDQRLPALIGERRVVVKIDVEGAEGLVVAGMRDFLASPQVECVVAEIDDENLRRFGSSAVEVYTAMELAGFHASRGMDCAEHFNEVFIRHIFSA